MLFSKKIDTYTNNGKCFYNLYENVSYGKIHSYSIKKYYDNKMIEMMCKNIKSYNAIQIIWNDVKNGIQK